MTDIEEITKAILAFRDERDWAQYKDNLSYRQANRVQRHAAY